MNVRDDLEGTQEQIDKIDAAIPFRSDTNGAANGGQRRRKLQIETINNADGNITISGAGEPNVFGTQTTQTGSDGLTQFTVNGTAVSLSTADANITAAVNDANLQLMAASSVFEAFDNGGKLGIREKVAQGVTLTLGGPDVGLFTGTTDTGTAGTGGSVKTVDQMVDDINIALAAW